MPGAIRSRKPAFLTARAVFGSLIFAVLPLAAEAQETRPWYTPGSRMVNLNALSRSVTDTMGIALAIEMPGAMDSAARVVRVGRVFTALAAAYAELKIPTEIRDSARLMMGNPQFYRRSDLGGRTLALYLECGQDINGIFAEIYRISMSLVTFLTPGGGDDIEVRTVLLASAVDIPRAQPNTRECQSTGELERRLYQTMLKLLGKQGFGKAPGLP
jgi:hypothetical protein